MPLKKKAGPGATPAKARAIEKQVRSPRTRVPKNPLYLGTDDAETFLRHGKSAIERKHMTFADHGGEFSWRLFRIMSEFVDGFEFLSRLQRTVTIFGSARLPEDSPFYGKAQEFAERLAREKFTVITGGGPGIMEAANRGAMEGNGLSVGLNIELPLEQEFNKYVKQGMGFHFFFSRKFMLDYSALAYVYFPGGYGTLDELFTVLTLIQTGKAERDVPVILFGVEYWKPLCEWIKSSLDQHYHLIAHDDLNIWHLTDDVDEALDIICKACDKMG